MTYDELKKCKYTFVYEDDAYYYIGVETENLDPMDTSFYLVDKKTGNVTWQTSSIDFFPQFESAKELDPDMFTL